MIWKVFILVREMWVYFCSQKHDFNCFSQIPRIYFQFRCVYYLVTKCTVLKGIGTAVNSRTETEPGSDFFSERKLLLENGNKSWMHNNPILRHYQNCLECLTRKAVEIEILINSSRSTFPKTKKITLHPVHVIFFSSCLLLWTMTKMDSYSKFSKWGHSATNSLNWIFHWNDKAYYGLVNALNRDSLVYVLLTA